MICKIPTGYELDELRGCPRGLAGVELGEGLDAHSLPALPCPYSSGWRGAGCVAGGGSSIARQQ